MTEYSLERLRILVVDDNKFTRNVLAKILAVFQVGEVIKAHDGLQAVQLLKDGRHGQPANVDIVISDVFMPSVDGFKLLQWVRESKDSPNRFMPFIMMSGAADDTSVGKARDKGANEFLAKPFSPNAVASRLFAVIDRPRQFVATQSYFGPDRKRQTSEEIIEERRKTSEDDVNVVYSAEMIVRPKDPTEVYFFRLRNALKEKVGGSDKSTGQLPLAVLEEADEMLGRDADTFKDWMVNYLRSIIQACRKASSVPLRGRSAMRIKINELAHELRGQGGIFGYQLVSEAAEMLFQITAEGNKLDDDALQLVQAHLDLMNRVFIDDITGDGGATGQVLLGELREQVARKTARQETLAEVG